MRQRKPKDLDNKLEQLSGYLISNPAQYRGRWHEVFGNRNPIYLELGCGKGQFISTHAARNPDRNYIGIEGQKPVVLRALEKAAALAGEREHANLCLACEFVQNIEEYFAPGELAGVYLNFSDPWPKARHNKRRLTYRGRLTSYGVVVSDGGYIEIKTDNEDLFAFTLEEVEAAGFVIDEMSRDLHGKDANLKAAEITTEYEDKFSGGGKNINYLKIHLNSN